MALPWMTYGVVVTTGQTITGWVWVAPYDQILITLESADAVQSGHMILETCDEVVGGVGQKPQAVTLSQDFAAPPLGSVRYMLQDNKFTYLRLSANSDSPGFTAINVNGGIFPIHRRSVTPP